VPFREGERKVRIVCEKTEAAARLAFGRNAKVGQSHELAQAGRKGGRGRSPHAGRKKRPTFSWLVYLGGKEALASASMRGIDSGYQTQRTSGQAILWERGMRFLHERRSPRGSLAFGGGTSCLFQKGRCPVTAAGKKGKTPSLMLFWGKAPLRRRVLHSGGGPRSMTFVSLRGEGKGKNRRPALVMNKEGRGEKKGRAG